MNCEGAYVLYKYCEYANTQAKFFIMIVVIIVFHSD
jgi:hypothetical protein